MAIQQRRKRSAIPLVISGNGANGLDYAFAAQEGASATGVGFSHGASATVATADTKDVAPTDDRENTSTSLLKKLRSLRLPWNKATVAAVTSDETPAGTAHDVEDAPLTGTTPGATMEMEDNHIDLDVGIENNVEGFIEERNDLTTESRGDHVDEMAAFHIPPAALDESSYDWLVGLASPTLPNAERLQVVKRILMFSMVASYEAVARAIREDGEIRSSIVDLVARYLPDHDDIYAAVSQTTSFDQTAPDDASMRLAEELLVRERSDSLLAMVCVVTPLAVYALQLLTDTSAGAPALQPLESILERIERRDPFLVAALLPYVVN